MRYHLFADETGQQSRGGYFIVGVVAVATADLDEVRAQVIDIELRSNRKGHKWARSTLKQKEGFVNSAELLLAKVSPVYFRSCGEGVAYGDWTAAAIAAAAAQRDPQGDFTAVVDGEPELRSIQRAFRQRGLRCHKVRGGRDESEPLLRLADFVAGFVADVHRERSYARPIWERFRHYFLDV